MEEDEERKETQKSKSRLLKNSLWTPLSASLSCSPHAGRRYPLALLVWSGAPKSFANNLH